MSDLLYDLFTGNAVGSFVNVSSHVPTRPYASGVTAWEYTGAQTDYMIGDFTLGTFTTLFSDGAVTGQVARLNAAFDHTRLEMWANLYKFTVDNVSDSMYFCFFVPNTAIASYTNISYIRAGVVRIGAGSIRPSIQWVNAAGTPATLATGRAISFPVGTRRRLFATVVEDVISLYDAETDGGLHATLICRARVPSALMVAGNDRVGLILTTGNAAGGTGIFDLHIRERIADMVPIPFRFNWPMQEQFSFLTDVMVGDDGQEQRIGVRNPDLPRRMLRANLTTLERDHTEHLMALLFGSNVMTVWPPLWWNASVVSANVAIGDQFISVQDATNREYNAVDDLTGPAQYVLLWSAPDTWEIHIVELVGANSFQFYWPTIHTFLAGTSFVLPLVGARLPESVDVLRHARHMAEADLEFLVDA